MNDGGVCWLLLLAEEGEEINYIHNGFIIGMDPDLPHGDLHKRRGGEQTQIRTRKGINVVVCLVINSLLNIHFFN